MSKTTEDVKSLGEYNQNLDVLEGCSAYLDDGINKTKVEVIVRSMDIDNMSIADAKQVVINLDDLTPEVPRAFDLDLDVNGTTVVSFVRHGECVTRAIFPQATESASSARILLG